MKHKLKTFFVLSSLSLFTIFMINRIISSLYSLMNISPDSENNYYEWRFGKIRYTRKGSGTPLLLIHNLTPGSSQYEYSKIINQLSKKHEVFSLDLLGYGLSDKPNITYTNYLYVQLISDFIKTVIGKKTNIIASGDSSPIAIMSCHNDPELLNQIILINPQSIYQLNQIPSKQTKLLKLLIETPIIGTFIYNLINNKNSFTKDFKEKYFNNPLVSMEDSIDHYSLTAHLNRNNSKYAYSSYIGKYMNVNIIHALKEINNNIFIIAGKEIEDIETIVENYIYYNISIESSYITNTKQLPQLEKPDELLKQIDIFLQ